jgi:transposase
LVDAQGLLLKAKIHRARVQDREGIKLLLEPSRDRLPQRRSHLWLDVGYTRESKGADWVQKALGWTAQIVRHPPKLAPEEMMRKWVMEWTKEGVAIDLKKLLPAKDSSSKAFLPRRWIVERTFSWLDQKTVG